MAKLVRTSTLVAGRAIVDPDTGNPSAEFLRTMNTNIQNLRIQLDTVSQLAEDIVFSIEQAGIALTTAEEAKELAEATAAEDYLLDSYTSPATILTASDALDGTATITVSNHNRVYGDGTSIAVTGGSITGLAYSTRYYVRYYDQDREGGAVTYAVTTDPASAGQGNGYHACGDVFTPASGGTDTGGGGVTPRGVRYYDSEESAL